MKTDVWIDMLACGAGPAPRAVAARRLLPVMLAGLLASSALAWLLMGLLPPAVFQTPAPWIKLAYAAALVVAASVLTVRLARPLARLRMPWGGVALVMGGMLALGAGFLWGTPPPDRWAVLLGQTWLICPALLLLLSLPSLLAILWVLRGLAPTRLAAAGLASGLLAGAIGAAGYALACPESSPTFVAVWYTLGIGLTALTGRLLGPYVLRW